MGARFKASRNGHVNILIMYYTRERWSLPASHKPMGFFLGKLQLGKQGGCKVLSFSHLEWSMRPSVSALHQFSTTLVLLHRKYIFGNSGIFYFGLLRESSQFF